MADPSHLTGGPQKRGQKWPFLAFLAKRRFLAFFWIFMKKHEKTRFFTSALFFDFFEFFKNGQKWPKKGPP